jgi:hypothetical protein
MEEALRWSAAGQPETSIAFPYFRGDRLLNIKYRSLEKKFRQVQANLPPPWGHQNGTKLVLLTC